MRIFYDTEFLENGRTIDLISIALIADDGRELYAVNRDAPWARIREHPWLMANVVAHLPGGRDPDRESLIDLDDDTVVEVPAIARMVLEFIEATPQPSLWAWYAAYDHVALCQLFGPMIDLPAAVPRWTNDVQQLLVASAMTRLPREPDDAHHALSDARYARSLADAAMTPTLSPRG